MLTAGRTLFENAWTVTVQNTHAEITRMCSRFNDELGTLQMALQLANDERARLSNELKKVINENETLKIQISKSVRAADVLGSAAQEITVDSTGNPNTMTVSLLVLDPNLRR
jgi:predicted ribosome quality control (RQC) complex YloA/Tae2 family protein